MQKLELLDNHTIDGYSGFVLLRENGQLLNASKLDLQIHHNCI